MTAKEDCGWGYYHCVYCQHKRYVGNVYPCAAGNKVAWSPTPWGVACQPDERGITPTPGVERGAA